MTKSSRHLLFSLLVLTLLGLTAYLFASRSPQFPAPASPDGYFFCFWNVENLFDDRDDHRTGPGDREYDSWFARDPAAFQLKLAHLCDALLQMNAGRGPD